MILAAAALAAVTAASPSLGAEPLEIDHEKFFFLGWNKACAVAVSHYGYPVLGVAIAEEPISTRIGTLTISPGEEAPKTSWAMKLDGKFTWNPDRAQAARNALTKAGYAKAGYKETMRPDPVVNDRDLPRLLLSTDTFKMIPPKDWAPKGYRLGTIYYNPLGSCGLMLFVKQVPGGEFFRPILVRLGNPAARWDRALAHVTNGLLLFERGDAPGALAETTIAAALAPDQALTHYHHGAMLSLSGATKEALDELEAAIAIDRQYKEKARQDPDWDSLSGLPRFKSLTGH